jgi:hypothetical protein
MGDPCCVAGKIGSYALDFDGDGDYVEVPDDTSLRFSQYDSFSICLWCKPVTNGYIVCKMRKQGQSGCFGYQLSWGSTKLRFAFYVEKSGIGSTPVYSGDISAPAGDWYHVAAVYDNKAMRIYLNGILRDSGTFAYDTGSTTPGKDLAIGARSYDSTVTGYFGGLADDVRIYDRALTEEEINQLYLMGN